MKSGTPNDTSGSKSLGWEDLQPARQNESPFPFPGVPHKDVFPSQARLALWGLSPSLDYVFWWLGFFCNLTRRSFKWLVALKENVKAEEKGRTSRAKQVSLKSWPWRPEGWSMDMKGFSGCKSRAPKGATFPEVHVAPTPHLACWSSIVSGAGSMGLSHHPFHKWPDPSLPRKAKK